MAQATPAALRHLDFSGRARAQHYTARGGGGGQFLIMQRTRATHARRLKGEILSAQTADQQRRPANELADFQEDLGLDLVIRSAPGAPLKLESFDAPRFGVYLKNSRIELVPQAEGDPLPVTIATVFVRHGKLDYLVKRIEAFATEGPRDHEALVANIESIGLAAIEYFWTSRHPLPESTASVWWEVWLRAPSSPVKRTIQQEAIDAEIRRLGLERKPGQLLLPEHTVILVKASQQALAGATGLLNFVSELRHPKRTAEEFTEQTPAQQQAVIAAFRQRVHLPANDLTAVCILDTGVNRGHPLLGDILAEADLQTVEPAWGTADHYPGGHGTQVAGLAAFGDLTQILAGNSPVQLSHFLESVKILPPTSQNEPEHYGAITQQGMLLAESQAAHRRRVFAIASTATDAPEFQENGRPSAWSAALDAFTAGYLEDDSPKRLVCVSAGNVRGLGHPDEYPSRNDVSSIEDPAQSWNALTIGAYTERIHVKDDAGNLLAGWTPLAKEGGLCPASCTSGLWSGAASRHWPIKPDIVMEGGNVAHDHTHFISNFDSLSVLSTGPEIQRRLLSSFNATSAATGLAAHFTAQLQTAYPALWPESIRGLAVRSAQWHPEMHNGLNLSDKGHVVRILRRFGHGVPDLPRARASARSRATLFAQDSLQPFEKDGARVVTRDMMIYKLPWPRELLQANDAAEVRLRVTLSYFIEPNPGARVSSSKYRYAGCNLRFQVQTPTETRANFIARISGEISAEDRAQYLPPTDTTDGWLIGDALRRRGSLHADTWTGTAANLAQMEHLIVYPVNGWWKLRPQLGRHDQRIRYSLVLTLESLGVDLNLYAPIETAIAVPITT